ncbi:hypothetical protein EV200_10142 [Pedobacter psychrotolerans]|uniref:Uncharacterized protein n=1 Tax=Pedobacter psychrotolerans TaxID=1843235 RepID=A0A4R2HKR9_9SPHI|nr:hypothetical protein EV200_10142 [Pedobacter psychrotolerans]
MLIFVKLYSVCEEECAVKSVLSMIKPTYF